MRNLSPTDGPFTGYAKDHLVLALSKKDEWIGPQELRN